MPIHQPIGIVGAMPQEINILIKQLDNPETTEVAGVTLTGGVLNNTPVIVMQSGIGKVNATLATTLMIERYRPQAIINTGSAGGIDTSLNVGDVVIGECVAHHDVDVTAFGYAVGQMAGMPASYPCDAHLITCAKQAASNFVGASIHSGQIVSGDQFIADSVHLHQIKANFTQALAVEMEAAAIAQTCYQFNLPFVVIRAISDLANEKASVSFDDFIETAGKHSAQMVIHLLKIRSSCQ